jgi:anaerobic magnesium-protoporphyrin IX monomethyl ester cyclase
MSRVLLINPSYEAGYRRVRAGLVNPVYPVLGLAAIAAEAERRGHVVRILDLSYLPYDARWIRATIRAWRPDLVGITAATPLMNQVRDLSVLCKDISPDLPVVAGGPHPSALPRTSLRESMLDGILAGEADQAFGELVDGAPLAELAGAWSREGDDVVHAGPRPLIADLDALPLPAIHLYPPDRYRGRISKLLVRCPPAATIEFSRGCVFKCDYCASKNTVGLGYRKKSPERCAEEVLQLARLGWGEFALSDDIFSTDRAWASRVCEAIIAAGAPLPWTCINGIRVESADAELFTLMRRAGCYRVSFGFESGSDAVLDGFGKGGKASIERGRAAARMARRAGIEVNGYFMVGLSSDDAASMEQTIEFARSVELDMVSIGATVPFPGTPMFGEAAREGRILSWDWDDYNAYAGRPVFRHPRLSQETILATLSRAYRRAILTNPGFVVRRLVRDLRVGELRSDLSSLVRFALLPSHQQDAEGVAYHARERWPVHDFAAELPEELAWPVARRSGRAS